MTDVDTVEHADRGRHRLRGRQLVVVVVQNFHRERSSGSAHNAIGARRTRVNQVDGTLSTSSGLVSPSWGA